MPQDLGEWGEELAADYLREKGWVVLEENYENALGECDLIADDGTTIVFVEVKTRSTDRFGPPEAAVTRDQREHLRRVARSFLSDDPSGQSCRFDVIAIEFDNNSPNLRHIPNAFGAYE